MSHFIDEYRFGHIVIDGKEFRSDVKIFPDRIEGNWWRASGHTLDVLDIQDILEQSPKLLIIGTGSAGVLKVPENTVKVIKDRGIELIIERTTEACNIYNEYKNKNEVIAAFHLTC
jgi:hypothetical protein